MHTSVCPVLQLWSCFANNHLSNWRKGYKGYSIKGEKLIFLGKFSKSIKWNVQILHDFFSAPWKVDVQCGIQITGIITNRQYSDSETGGTSTDPTDPQINMYTGSMRTTTTQSVTPIRQHGSETATGMLVCEIHRYIRSKDNLKKLSDLVGFKSIFGIMF